MITPSGYSSLISLLLIWSFSSGLDHQPHDNPLKNYNPPHSSQVDTMVNYCTLIRAAFFYGQKSTENTPSLSENDVKYFNDNWKQVFNIEFYQTGITNREFSSVQRFKEGNRIPFPPSALYHKENPDSYLLFHLAKEVGKIKSKAYEQCPACVKESIDKINALLRGTSLHTQISRIWLGTSTLKKITSVQEITDFWLFLRCLTIDDRVDPKSRALLVSLPPVVRCPDTTVIKCKDEIKPKVTVGYRHCEIGGKVDTIGPQIVKGIDNCPGTVYRFKFVARDQCFKKDSAYQYFVIKNDPPDITCPHDTIIDCIEHLVIHKPGSSSSCNLGVKISHKKPVLVAGTHNCPYATYKMEYMISDSCGRKESCMQTITIQNDPPKITCPHDTIVECSKYIKKGNVKYTTSCKRWAEVTTSLPKLIKGKPDCDGTVYEMTYTVKDSCDRTASCTRKFTIKNKGPEIECPQYVEVLCFEDINVGQPKSIKVSCDLGYDLKISDPRLIIGKHNCTGAVYSVTFTVTDDCGRTDECEQLFTILQPEMLIQCPPNQKVRCVEDIKPSEAIIKIACKRNYKVATSKPVPIRGSGNCPDSEYGIVYTVSDDCGLVKTCTQIFTIDNPDPEIVCGAEVTVDCDQDLDMMKPVPVVSCDLNYEVTYTDPVLISGLEDCDGARYKMTFTVTDECGRTASCDQLFKIRIPPTEVICEGDKVVECEKDITPTSPKVTTYCDLKYQVDQQGPVLVKGKKDCPSAEYTITYTVTDECKRKVVCTQRFTIDNLPPTITCPPDRTVQCEEDIVDEDVLVATSCGDDGGTVLGPVLVSGIAGCPNAVYIITYTITDLCGRKAECDQRFTLSGDDLQVVCPHDTVISSKADIVPAEIYASTSCDVDADVDVSGPTLISGTDDQFGAVYEIIYTIVDACGQRETCKQRFTIIGIKDGCKELCDCTRELKNVSLDVLRSDDDRFNKDIAALIKKYGCKKLKEWAQKGVVELWNAWSASEILGSETGIASEIARRGNINQVMQNLENINKLIEVLEEAINGEPKKTMEKIAELMITDGVTYLTGSGTPALVFTSIKSLGQFAEYLNNEILIINLKTISNYAENDPCIFDPDHYLLKYAKIREIKSGDPTTWSDIHNTFRIAIYEYAQHRMSNTNLPPISEIWKSQQNMTLLRTATHSMLKEVCQYWCYKLTLKKNLNKLIQEQSLLLRFRDIMRYIDNYDCKDDEKPCTMPNAELVEINGRFECNCIQGYKWDPGKIRCIPFTDCSTMYNSVEVYQGDRYECDCPSGYEWNADKTSCILSVPDCNSYYPHSYAALNAQTNAYECYCLAGYEWNANRTECVLTVPDCELYYPHSYAVLNTQTNTYECHCNEGYEWNAGRTACVLTIPDCPSYYPNSYAVLNPQTNKYECYCLQGYEWNTARTECMLSVPDCPSYYPNSYAALNPQTNKYECYCLTGYVWNATKTECMLSVPDCNSFYPNTIAAWNAATNQYECNCIQGYEWNTTRTACVLSPPNCSLYYANSTAVWNPASNQYECNCLPGYIWNATRTACDLAVPDCSQYYANTIAAWNAATNQYECNCIQGFVWNANRTGCVSSTPDCNSYYPNTIAVWNAQTNQYECNCIQGYEWNATRTGCIVSTNRDNPPVNPEQQKTGDCNIAYRSGANEPEQYTIDVHRTSGSLVFNYDTETIKDRIHVYYGNAKIFDTGCVGATGSQTFALNGYTSVFTIIVDPLCDPTESNTSWSFTLGCPQ